MNEARAETSPGSWIVEGLMTTLSLEGKANIAPMGPRVDAGFTQFILRPFKTSTTYQNLKANGQGVFHVTDDALMIARGAMGTLVVADVPARPAAHVKGLVLTGACRYHELQVEKIDDAEDRTMILARPVHRETLRDFVGFNRARHAVIEAAILATRLHLTGTTLVLEEYQRLRIMVEKTGGSDEHQAMAELTRFVQEAKLGQGQGREKN